MNKNAKLLIVDAIRLKLTYTQEEFAEAISVLRNPDDQDIRRLLELMSPERIPSSRGKTLKEARGSSKSINMPTSLSDLKAENPSYYGVLLNLLSKMSRRQIVGTSADQELIMEKFGIRPSKTGKESPAYLIIDHLAKLPESVGMDIINKIQPKLKPQRNQYVDLANVIISGSKKKTP